MCVESNVVKTLREIYMKYVEMERTEEAENYIANELARLGLEPVYHDGDSSSVLNIPYVNIFSVWFMDILKAKDGSGFRVYVTYQEKRIWHPKEGSSRHIEGLNIEVTRLTPDEVKEYESDCSYETMPDGGFDPIPLNIISPLINFMKLLGWEDYLAATTPHSITIVFYARGDKDVTIPSRLSLNLNLPQDLVAEILDVKYEDGELKLWIEIEKLQ